MNKDIFEMRLSHLGQIGFRLSLFALIFVVGLLLSTIISSLLFGFVAIIGFILPIITLGFVIVINPNYFSDLTNLLDNSSAVLEFLAKAVDFGKYVAIAGIIGSVIGAIFLLANKNDRHWGKFTFCIISIVLCLIVFIMIISGTFQQG